MSVATARVSVADTRRIGGLEKCGYRLYPDSSDTRRIGGLET